MKIRGNNREKLYATIRNIYSHYVSSFSFKAGEKGRIKRVFNRFAEEMGIRDEDRFDEVLDLFSDYVERQTKRWLNWKKGVRGNWVGFLDRQEDLEVFVAKTFHNDTDENTAEQVVGQEDPDAWEF